MQSEVSLEEETTTFDSSYLDYYSGDDVASTLEGETTTTDDLIERLYQEFNLQEYNSPSTDIPQTTPRLSTLPPSSPLSNTLSSEIHVNPFSAPTEVPKNNGITNPNGLTNSSERRPDPTPFSSLPPQSPLSNEVTSAMHVNPFVNEASSNPQSSNNEQVAASNENTTSGEITNNAAVVADAPRQTVPRGERRQYLSGPSSSSISSESRKPHINDPFLRSAPGPNPFIVHSPFCITNYQSINAGDLKEYSIEELRFLDSINAPKDIKPHECYNVGECAPYPRSIFTTTIPTPALNTPFAFLNNNNTPNPNPNPNPNLAHDPFNPFSLAYSNSTSNFGLNSAPLSSNPNPFNTPHINNTHNVNPPAITNTNTNFGVVPSTSPFLTTNNSTFSIPPTPSVPTSVLSTNLPFPTTQTNTITSSTPSIPTSLPSAVVPTTLPSSSVPPMFGSTSVSSQSYLESTRSLTTPFAKPTIPSLFGTAPPSLPTPSNPPPLFSFSSPVIPSSNTPTSHNNNNNNNNNQHHHHHNNVIDSQTYMETLHYANQCYSEGLSSLYKLDFHNSFLVLKRAELTFRFLNSNNENEFITSQVNEISHILKELQKGIVLTLKNSLGVDLYP